MNNPNFVNPTQQHAQSTPDFEQQGSELSQSLAPPSFGLSANPVQQKPGGNQNNQPFQLKTEDEGEAENISVTLDKSFEGQLSSIEVFDLEGKSVLAYCPLPNSTSISFSGVSERGIFFVKITNAAGETVVRKVLMMESSGTVHFVFSGGEGEQAEQENEAGGGDSAISAEITNENNLPHNLGMDKSVGEGGVNDEADMAIAREKLVALGLLAPDVTDLNSLKTAIGDFQDLVGIKRDENMSAGGGTARALTTYYLPNPESYDSFETALDEITLVTKEASASFATETAGATINASSTPAAVNISAMIEVQNRLFALRKSFMGSDFSNTDLVALKDKSPADFTEEDKTIISGHITKTVAGITAFQTAYKTEWWSNKKREDEKSLYVLTDTETALNNKAGEMADGDATHYMLKEYKNFTMKWTGLDGNEKSKSSHNFQKAPDVTTFEEGIGHYGNLDPEQYPLSSFESAGNIDESRAKALRAASEHEGNFDAVNMYDKAVTSWGFIQFAGGHRKFEYLMARIKTENPATFRDLLQRFGFDVEYKTNGDGVIDKTSCRMIIHDPSTDTTYRDMDAEHAIKNNPKLAAVLMRAAESDIIKDMQIAVAVSDYVVPSENIKMRYKVSVLKVDNGEDADPTIKCDVFYKLKYDYKKKENVYRTDKSEITDFKATDAYTTALAEERVTEVTLEDELLGLKLGEIMQSEKERAALYGTYINVPGWSQQTFRKAIVAIITEQGLTTIEDIKAIDPVTLLEKAATFGKNSEHKERINDAKDDANLSG